MQPSSVNEKCREESQPTQFGYLLQSRYVFVEQPRRHRAPLAHEMHTCDVRHGREPQKKHHADQQNGERCPRSRRFAAAFYMDEHAARRSASGAGPWHKKALAAKLENNAVGTDFAQREGVLDRISLHFAISLDDNEAALGIC